MNVLRFVSNKKYRKEYWKKYSQSICNNFKTYEENMERLFEYYTAENPS